MSIEKMSMVSLRGERAYLDEVLLSCTNSGYFHPEMASALSEYANSLTTLKEENPYTAIMKELDELSRSVDIELHYTSYDALQLQAKDFAGYVADLSASLGKLLQRRSGVLQLIESHNRTLAHLKHLHKLDQNFDDIFQSKYLEVRFGRLPVESYEKLSFYQDKPYIIFSYDNDSNYHWCLYLCAASDKQEIDGLFASLYFERIRIPDYAHGTPDQSIAFIQKDLSREQTELESLNGQIAAVLVEQRPTLEMLYTKSKVLAEAFDLRKYAAYVKNDFVVIGFVPRSHEKDFAACIEHLSGHVALSLRQADADQRLVVPVRLKNNWLLKPFEMFVNIYGLPSYKDVDPTPFLGITYILLFGIMFGDLGQGFLIVLLGLFLEKTRKMALGGVMARIGVSSMIFGFLYGSVFGFEELLIPVHQALFGTNHLIQVMAPATTNTILMGAIALGIIIIMASILMNIFLGLRKKDFERAIFSNNGVAGLVFYGAVIYAAVSTLLLNQAVLTPVYTTLLIVLPLVIIFLKEPLGHLLHRKQPFPNGIGGFILESFFEMFEVLLSFVSNTMSFLRVGGFILSHAGMMAVVMTLSGMVGMGASPFVVIIGNLFVMALEGLIVGIQVLRLEFYEIFSRFYDGDGKQFNPVHTGITQ